MAMLPESKVREALIECFMAGGLLDEGEACDIADGAIDAFRSLNYVIPKDPPSPPSSEKE